jgi:hypothetical protein
VWDFDFLEMDIETELAQLGSDVIHGGLCLQRSAGARANVFGQMSDLPVGVVVRQRGRPNRREFLQQQRREVLLLRLGLLRRRHERNGRVLGRRVLGTGGARKNQ